MAYFRCGGGGIPSSLKSGMNDVLNKKFGTSTTYAPATWPDNVNLLGPLPEKTVSGAIASFSDGADDVPIKSATFGIVASGGNGTPSAPVPIVGKSSVTVYQTGKNLYKTVAPSRTNNDVTYTVNSDGTISLSGTASATSYFTSNTGSNRAYMTRYPAGTYTLSGGISNDIRVYAACYDDSGNVLSYNFSNANGNPKTETINQPFWFRIQVAVTNGMDTTGIEIKPMLEVGNQATTYEAYKSKTPITIQLGQTVYGGQYDFNTGVFTVTHELLTLDGSEDWQRSGTYNGSFYYDTGTHHIFSSVNSLCSHLVQAYPFPANYASGKFGLNGANSQFLNIWIMPANSTVDELVTYLQTQYNNGTPVQVALELATPIVITGLDEISLSTYLGDNNIWCDTGDSEVTYRADINLALNQ